MPRAKPLPPVEYLHSILRYDAMTGVFHWRWRDDAPKNWNNRRAGKKAGAIHIKGYVVLGINGTVYLAHRIAWLMTTGHALKEREEIDHINRDRKDNRIANLRVANRHDQGGNRPGSRNKLLPKGVYAERGKYRAIIRISCRSKYLGYFDTVAEAKDAYMKAAIVSYGEFASAG